jgi:hypothetical protein
MAADTLLYYNRHRSWFPVGGFLGLKRQRCYFLNSGRLLKQTLPLPRFSPLFPAMISSSLLDSLSFKLFIGVRY